MNKTHQLLEKTRKKKKINIEEMSVEEVCKQLKEKHPTLKKDALLQFEAGKLKPSSFGLDKIHALWELYEVVQEKPTDINEAEENCYHDPGPLDDYINNLKKFLKDKDEQLGCLQIWLLAPYNIPVYHSESLQKLWTENIIKGVEYVIVISEKRSGSGGKDKPLLDTLKELEELFKRLNEKLVKELNEEEEISGKIKLFLLQDPEIKNQNTDEETTIQKELEEIKQHWEHKKEGIKLPIELERCESKSNKSFEGTPYNIQRLIPITGRVAVYLIPGHRETNATYMIYDSSPEYFNESSSTVENNPWETHYLWLHPNDVAPYKAQITAFSQALEKGSSKCDPAPKS